MHFTEAEIYDRWLENSSFDPDDPRTYNMQDAIAYLRERRYQQEQARAAFQASFDMPDRPRNVTAREALRTGNWGGFFTFGGA